ncbi:hypothetical protein Ae168Ps1_5517c [Pseudonocardia sp. Ae168_Ps1]|uniref:hypothetical protein n=1 Tax=unclassified Pseudonocardia TaxID=2619320 RepID=UPI00096809DA|nr:MULTISPECIES: hypothetical protein [unclassified Pseudonocardia]OLL71014.1 hypothetical protein Ae168Ps1_5517c [Pseudonocardia sp. Ae168_Ps1]OLL88452.1 hypothetical protein Ae263Ps1_5507c [Pseudonocardia sp. Ae263_Ps1]OLL91525.1 hypothetical protein Ae356Ps1_1422 [Pseudonocardia sp. Ae356_Ps1]
MTMVGDGSGAAGAGDSDSADTADSALAALGAELDASIADLESARQRVLELQELRSRGLGWREIVPQENRPLIVESVTRALDGLGAVGGRFRREEAVALHGEGETIAGIGRLFGVSRQRVSAYLQEHAQVEAGRAAGQAGAEDVAGAGDVAGDVAGAGDSVSPSTSAERTPSEHVPSSSEHPSSGDPSAEHAPTGAGPPV